MFVVSFTMLCDAPLYPLILKYTAPLCFICFVVLFLLAFFV